MIQHTCYVHYNIAPLSYNNMIQHTCYVHYNIAPLSYNNR